MSPDPGSAVEDGSPVVTTALPPAETTTTSSDTSMESNTMTTSQTAGGGDASTSTLPMTGQRRGQRTVAEEAAELGLCPGPSTSSSTSLQAPNPRRHRQRLANHYLNQIRSTQQSAVPGASSSRSVTTATASSSSSSSPPFHHYYHPYHQHHHHQHLHYPTYPAGYYSRTPAALATGTLPALRGSSRGTRSGTSERSPFLMVKILLFSLMTIDFVMNSIGLAVIAVMAKNHFANLAVERSLHPPPPLEPSAPLPEDPYHRTVYSHPYSSSATANEWTILLPLLPSFLFVELLTLVGMFGVFVDSFAFVMTYAILKLITSLCYPSMASAAAVAAMATVTSTSSGGVGQPSSVNIGGVGVGSITTGFHPNQGASSNFVPSILPLPLPENFTAFLSQAKYLSLKNSSAYSGGGAVTRLPFETSTTIPPTSWPTWMTPTTTPSFDTPTTPYFESSLPPTTSSPSLATQTPSPPPATTSNHLDPDETSSKSYKHSRLKHDKLMAAMKAAKKTDKMAKLKAREKQLRSKLLRLESAESSPSNWTLPSSSVSSPASHARVSLLLPPSSGSLDPAVASSSFNNAHSNIKYHHRVWDALLVTFEVIFAVAFAFNTLTSHSRREMGEDSDEEETVGGSGDEGLGRTRRRIRRFRSSRGGGYHWPYSPLATSVDAFYFAQYQLPPPPPPYFGAAQLTQAAPLRQPQRSASARHSASPGNNPTPIHRRSHRSLLDYTANWRRFTPSWLRPPPLPPPGPVGPAPRLSPTPSLRSLPPLYEDIHHDDPVVYLERHIRQQLPNELLSTETPTSNDRTVLQMTVTEATSRPRRSPRRSTTPLRDLTELTESTPPESPNLKSKSQTPPSSESNITSIKVPEPATGPSTVSEANKTLVLAINQNDTRV